MTTLVIPDLVGWAALVGAIAALVGWLFKGFAFVKEPENIKNEIAEIRAEQSSIKSEQRVLTAGILACLKGLKEQGCNGPVTEAIKEIEEHINNEAHK